MLISISGDADSDPSRITSLAEITKLEISSQTDYLLYLSANGVELRDNKNRKFTPLRVDFNKGQSRHRRLHGSGKRQLLARAIGLHKHHEQTVLDATAGLGTDAFVLATLGCNITLLERSPVIYALLNDGMKRAEDDLEIAGIIQRMHLHNIDANTFIKALSDTEKPDVIFLDPMFPETRKSALSKKAMQIFHEIVGPDHDNEQLLENALLKASRRVVVKRRLRDPLLSFHKPTFNLEGKTARYDVYST